MNHEVDFVMLVTISYTCYAFGLVFTVCELGERASGAFVEIYGKIEEFKWYLLPNRIQQMMPIILILAQQPVSYECFASILCNRTSFEGVSLNQIGRNIFILTEHSTEQPFWFIGDQNWILILYDASSIEQINLRSLVMIHHQICW